ncbi:MAG TPA: HAD-IA family hydrolase [Gaiellales bacterium]|nr:HAD-IA family hydrolase [Gaiellales bacterium]
MPPQAILFDLDDTLLATTAADRWRVQEVVRLAASWPGVPAAEFERRYRDVDARDRHQVDSGAVGYREYRRRRIAAASAPWHSLSARDLDCYERICDGSIVRCVPLPGAVDAVARTRRLGLATGILTNGPSDVQRRKIAAAGLAWAVDVIVVSAERGVVKPAPEIFALACAELGVAPGGVAMVGDSLSSDVTGALAAGLGAAAWVDAGHDPPPPGAIRITGAAAALSALLS